MYIPHIAKQSLNSLLKPLSAVIKFIKMITKTTEMYNWYDQRSHNFT